MRNRASIQRVKKIETIEGADFILKATVLGWHCVVRKDENFKEGDVGVYFEIDSLLPDIPAFEFLKTPGKFPKEGFVHRLKTKKLKGVISQGLIMPLSAFPQLAASWGWSTRVGSDVTKQLGMEKYEPPIHDSLKMGIAEGCFPRFIPETDEIRIQSIPHIIDEIKGRPVYITCKYDGTSSTFFLKNGRFGVCSRTVLKRKPVAEPKWRKQTVWIADKIGILKVIRKYGFLRKWYLDARNTYWKIAEKYRIEEKLRDIGRNIAIQGEICGPSIQKNRLGLKENQLFVFDIYDIDKKKYCDYHEQVEICKTIGLDLVKEEAVTSFTWETVDDILDFAKGKYESGHNREGIVIRTLGENRTSFKAINNDYL